MNDQLILDRNVILEKCIRKSRRKMVENMRNRVAMYVGKNECKLVDIFFGGFNSLSSLLLSDANFSKPLKPSWTEFLWSKGVGVEGIVDFLLKKNGENEKDAIEEYFQWLEYFDEFQESLSYIHYFELEKDRNKFVSNVKSFLQKNPHITVNHLELTFYLYYDKDNQNVYGGRVYSRPLKQDNHYEYKIWLNTQNILNKSSE